MEQAERIEQLLDDWNDLLESNPAAELDAFIRQHATHLTATELIQFRRVACQLADLDRRLGELVENSSAYPSANLESSREHVVFLRPGLEPVPGYQLLEPLGQGGFGQVWKAFGPGGFPVALKFVRLGDQAGQAELQSLEIIREIRHPHLLSIFGTWQIEDRLVIASELADESLQGRFELARQHTGRGIPPRELLRYMMEAAQGIDFLNQPRGDSRPGVQHRDIKPQNLLLSGGSIKLGDYGLVRPLTHDITGHTGRLTLAFAAPEFLEGKTSHRSDQYSLAITYCYLRTGVLPFSGSEIEIIDGHRNGQPDLTELDPAAREVVERALSKSPEDRWPSCQAFVKSLIRAMAAPSAGSPATPNLLQSQRESSLRLKIWKWPLVGVIALVAFSALVVVLPEVTPNFIGNFRLPPPSVAANHAPPVPAVRVANNPNGKFLVPELEKDEQEKLVLEPELAPGWRRLFNGKNIDGWWVQGRPGWSVANGTVVSHATSPDDTGYLMTADQYQNYELRLEFRLSPDSDSGIFLNALPEHPVDGSQFLEVELAGNQRPGSSPPSASSRSGSLVGIGAADPIDLPTGTWHVMEISKHDRRIVISMNGRVVLDQSTADASQGHIGLQLSPTRCEFRNIQIRANGPVPLSPSESKLIDALQGTWELKSESVHDGPVSAEILARRDKRLTITRDEFWIEYNSLNSDHVSEETGIIVLDHKTNPVTVDMPYRNNQGKRLVYRGVLRLEGNRLRHRFIKIDPGDSSKHPPQSFDAPLRPGVWENVYERAN
ncbi:family 16 glycoside hydrolase [Rubinisphaera margarita]|uniref:family 16 glycoside hydrolase n=1 Tax=Rubinisphaera margarita TaxID=2909586 RepID=UPI001EE97C8E|nr:family 16 glycoside hydrolase [Rubinisphaera margarita]MCG6154657.1 DUF1080 domain-containing protein [Rubinisphaera margarita]